MLTARAPAPVLAYRWNTGATTQSITVAQPGTYSVTATFSGGGTSTDQHLVTAITPTVRIAGDTVLCAGQALSLVATAPGARSLRWSTGATTASISVSQAGTYSVTAAYGTGCAVTTQLTIRAATLRIDGPGLLCADAGASTVLTAVAPGATAYRWNTGPTTRTLTATQAGTYSVVATFANGCTLTVAQAVVRPVAAIGGDSVLCAGKAGQLTATLPGVATATYRWNTGATTPTLAISQPGTYSVAVSYGTGCLSTLQKQVRAGLAAPVFSLGADTTACEGAAVLLRAPALRPGVRYRWPDGSAGPTLRVSQAGQYTLQVITECETRPVSRQVNFQSCLEIPNVVTANGDGRNDRFKIKGLVPGTWQLLVFDRWGSKVFDTATYQNDWGRDAAPGVYFYRLWLPNGSASYKGWVEVLR